MAQKHEDLSTRIKSRDKQPITAIDDPDTSCHSVLPFLFEATICTS